jgi:hypothetical protein
MNKPLSLSDRQLKLIKDAARAVPLARRDEFLQRVARYLTHEPTYTAVIAAVNAQLDLISHHFLCDTQFGANK